MSVMMAAWMFIRFELCCAEGFGLSKPEIGTALKMPVMNCSERSEVRKAEIVRHSFLISF